MTDSHIHLSFLNDDDLEYYISESGSLGVQQFIMAGWNSDDWDRQIYINSEYPSAKCCFGLHPWVAQNLSQSALDFELELLQKKITKAQFLGETGLDYYSAKTDSERAKQRYAFEKTLEIYSRSQIPLVLHAVQADKDTLDILKKQNLPLKGIVHAFSGSHEIASEFISLGLAISIGPGILKEGYKKLKLSAEKLPARSLVIESDSPHSGKKVNPKLILEVLDRLAEIRHESPKRLVKILEKNIQSLLLN